MTCIRAKKSLVINDYDIQVTMEFSKTTLGGTLSRENKEGICEISKFQDCKEV